MGPTSSRKTVLIVTSTYAPAMTADMHRARHLAWDLPAQGWDVEILAPGSSYQSPEFIEADSGPFFCPSTPVHLAPAPGRLQRALVRASTIGWRAFAQISALGSRLLATGRFSLVYFSTTQFLLLFLGSRWRRQFGVPFVVDIQDPIFRPAGAEGHLRGSKLRKAVNRSILRCVEANALAAASGLVSVSSGYLAEIRSRHGLVPGPDLPLERQLVLPFPGSMRDLAVVSRGRVTVPSANDVRRIVYVGVGGAVMLQAFRALCRELRKLRNRGADRLRFELHGTASGWRDGDPCELAGVAAEEGVAGQVWEAPRRVTYRRSLELLLDADAALVLGVDDPAYIPSKLSTYALAGKPILAVMRGSSESAEAIRALGRLACLMPFGPEAGEHEAEAGLAEFLRVLNSGVQSEGGGWIDRTLAAASALQHARLFDACLPDRLRRAETGE